MGPTLWRCMWIARAGIRVLKDLCVCAVKCASRLVIVTPDRQPPGREFLPFFQSAMQLSGAIGDIDDSTQ